MGNLQVKNVPDELHTELRRRAELAGMTVRDYVLRVIRRDLRVPAPDELRARIRELEPVLGGTGDVVATLAEARGERDAQLTTDSAPDDPR